MAEKYGKAEAKIEAYEKELLEVGRQTADRNFKSVRYKGDRNVMVSPDVISINDFRLTARGSDVIFMEYGSGIDAVHPDGASKGFTLDSWSSTLGTGQFHNNGFWYYNGEKLVGQPPSMAMYFARKDILNNLNETFGEAFK